MKRHTTSTTAAPRRFLLGDRTPTEVANATTTSTPATNNSTTSSKATTIPPPEPPKHHRYYPSDNPPPDSSTSSGASAADTVRFDSSSVAVTALVILSALFFLGFFSVYARRFFAPNWDNPDASTSRRRRLARRGRIPTGSAGRAAYGHSALRGLDSDAIKALPLVRYAAAAHYQQGKSKDGKEGAAVVVEQPEEDHRCCAVCLGEFEEGEELRAIPGCGHAFHRECIDAWLSARGSCPLCRTTDLFGTAKADVPQRRCEVCRLESVVVVPAAEEAVMGSEAAAEAGQMEGGAGQRRSEGDNGQPPEAAQPTAAALVASSDVGGLGVMGRSRSWLCMSVASAEELADEEKGPPPAAVARDEQPPRRSCS